MKKIKGFKYISYRILALWLFLLCGLAIWVISSVIMLLNDEMPLLYLVFLIVFVAIFLVFSVYRIYRPYKEYEKLTSRFLDGYEFSNANLFLTPSTEKQVNKIEDILHSPEIFDINKRQAQYLALQNQINPHFLYNTLESIRSEALIAELDSVADMTEALAIFFRYTISKVENLVSVEEELENCKTYWVNHFFRGITTT